MKFVKENVNPLNKKVGDCVIRAICKATGRNWLLVSDNLYFIARKNFSTSTYNDTFTEYLKEFETNTCNAVKGKQRKKVEDFKKGTYILKTANHLTCVVDNVNFDLFDNRKRAVYRYWRVK